MSKATNQLLEIMRFTAATQREKRQEEYSLYCPCCRKYTFHTIDPQGTWEHYYCRKCGNQQSYRVG